MSEITASDWEKAMAWVMDQARNFTAEDRKKMAKQGSAMKDGSFPIATKEDWFNARQAIGRTDPSKRAEVVAHIIKRGKALGVDPKEWENIK